MIRELFMKIADIGVDLKLKLNDIELNLDSDNFNIVINNPNNTKVIGEQDNNSKEDDIK